MKKYLKWISLGLAGLAAVIILAVAAVNFSVMARLNRTYPPRGQVLAVPTDAAAVERGKHWADVLCSECHGEDLAGKTFLDDPQIGKIISPNLTGGQGGVGQALDDAGWVQALRYGVGSDNRSILVMPSKQFFSMSDDDLAELIAYLKTLPPVDRDPGETQLSTLGRLLLAAGAFGDVISAENIPASEERPPKPARGVTVEYGAYLVTLADCAACHGEELRGAQPPEPGSPYAPDITSTGGVVRTWSDADFIDTMRTGVTPAGFHFDRYMPWKAIGAMNDDELKAVRMYLQSLPGSTAAQ